MSYNTEIKGENAVAIIEIHFKKDNGIVKNLTAYASEEYFFYQDEIHDALKAIETVFRYLRKHDGYMYLKMYDNKNPAQVASNIYFVSADFITRDNGTVRTGEYDESNFFINSSEQILAFKEATAKAKEVIETIFSF